MNGRLVCRGQILEGETELKPATEPTYREMCIPGIGIYKRRLEELCMSNDSTMISVAVDGSKKQAGVAAGVPF